MMEKIKDGDDKMAITAKFKRACQTKSITKEEDDGEGNGIEEIGLRCLLL